MVLRTTTKDENWRSFAVAWTSRAAREAELLWRAVEPAYECGPDAVTHNELPRTLESTRRRMSILRASCAVRQQGGWNGSSASMLLRIGRSQEEHTACVLYAEQNGKRRKEKRRFGTFPSDLLTVSCPIGFGNAV
jgi:hypothetical protein